VDRLVTHEADSIELDGDFVSAKKAFPDKNRVHRWMGTIQRVDGDIAYSIKDLCYGKIEALESIKVGY
jgi:hypothetical protein